MFDNGTVEATTAAAFGKYVDRPEVFDHYLGLESWRRRNDPEFALQRITERIDEAHELLAQAQQLRERGLTVLLPGEDSAEGTKLTAIANLVGIDRPPTKANRAAWSRSAPTTTACAQTGTSPTAATPSVASRT